MQWALSVIVLDVRCEMESFKNMLGHMQALIDLMEHRTDVPYMLKGEVSYIRSVLEDVDRRMKKDLEGYKETT